MSEYGYVEVRNFEQFQHYKDRNPTWIKLYPAVLDDYEFSRLPDASKMHLMGIWMLASKCGNRIPADPEWIAQRIGATEPVDIQVLVHAGFLNLVQPASELLARCEHPASPEKRREEGETEKNLPPAREYRDPGLRRVADAVLTELPEGNPDASPRDAFRALMRASRSPDAFAAEVRMVLQGGRDFRPQPTTEQVGKALWEMHVNGKPPEVRVLHTYVDGAMRGTGPPRRGGRSEAPTATTPVKTIRKVS